MGVGFSNGIILCKQTKTNTLAEVKSPYLHLYNQALPR